MFICPWVFSLRGCGSCHLPLIYGSLGSRTKEPVWSRSSQGSVWGHEANPVDSGSKFWPNGFLSYLRSYLDIFRPWHPPQSHLRNTGTTGALGLEVSHPAGPWRGAIRSPSPRFPSCDSGVEKQESFPRYLGSGGPRCGSRGGTWVAKECRCLS